MRRSLGALVVAAAVTATLAFSASALAAGSLLQISSDPFTNVSAQHKTQVEPDTVAWGHTWVAAFQSGRIFGGGASNIGFAVSHDGGATFTHGFLPGTTFFASPAGIYPAVSDASVAYDARHGVWLISYLGLFPHDSAAVNVLVSRSIDGGNTWSTPISIASTDAFFDKNWTTCDNTPTSPFYGHCYTEFDNASQSDLELLSTSTDGGLTWGRALATPDRVHGLGGQPVVQPDGRLIVPFEGFNDTSLLVKSFSSNDGGASLTKSVTVAAQFVHAPGGDLRAPALPSARIDAGGKVYVVWADCRFERDCSGPFDPSSANDLVLSTSTNGDHWSAPVRIPLDAVGSGVDHFLPGLGIDPATAGSSARMALVYYYYPVAACHTSTCQLDVGFSTSSDGGATWTAGSQLAGPMHLTWLPLTSQGYMVGDYFSTSYTEGVAYPAFMVAAPPTSDSSSCVVATPNCDQGTFTVMGGLPGAATARTASLRARAVERGTFKLKARRAGRHRIAVPTAR